MRTLNVGDVVRDSWWPLVCGTIERVNGSGVHLRVKHPSLVPSGFGMKDGVIHYDMAHARRYLVKETSRKARP